MATIAELDVKIRSEFTSVKKDLRKLRDDLDKSQNTAEKSSRRMSTAFKAVATAVAAIGIVKLTKSLVSLASEAEETRNKFNVVFSSIRKDADAAAQNLQKNFGLSSQGAQQLLSDTGDLLTGFGLTQEEALKLADATAQLGVDLASFTNYAGGAEGATQALAAAMLGERERVKALGIALTETDLKQFAEDQGKVWEQMSRGEKATLTLELAMKQSKNAIGDFERSQDSFANVQRRVTARLQDMGAELGEKLLPAFSKLGLAFLEASENGGILHRVFATIVTTLALAINQVTIFARTVSATAKLGDIKKIDEDIKKVNVSFKALRDEAATNFGSFQKFTQAVKRGNKAAREYDEELRALIKERERLIQLRGGNVTAIQDINNATQELRAEMAKEIKTIDDIISGREYELENLEETQLKKNEIVQQHAEARKQFEIKKAKEAALAALTVMSQLTGQLGGILNQYVTNRNITLDNDRVREQTRLDESYQAQKEQIENNIQDEAERNAALKALDEKKARDDEKLNQEVDKKRRKIARDAASKQKKLAIAETLIAIPQAAFAAFKAMAGIPYVGPILGGIAAAAATALGFAKLALIKQQPLPAAQYGGVFDQPYIGGEAGREIAVPLESDQGQNAIQQFATGMLDAMSQQIDARASIEKPAATGGTSVSNVYLDGTLVGKWISKASDNGLFRLNARVVV